jgi:hypothetical protein
MFAASSFPFLSGIVRAAAVVRAVVLLDEIPRAAPTVPVDPGTVAAAPVDRGAGAAAPVDRGAGTAPSAAAIFTAADPQMAFAEPARRGEPARETRRESSLDARVSASDSSSTPRVLELALPQARPAHPHRHPIVRGRRARRPGSPTPRPQPCLTPLDRPATMRHGGKHRGS